MPRPRSRPTHQDIGTGFILLAVVAGLTGGALSLILHLPPAILHLWVGLPAADIPERALALQHGAILVFFSAIPALIGGFGNWLVPPQIGSRDTAFPALATASLGLAVAGFVLTIGGLLLGMPDRPLLLAVAPAAVALILCSANLVATILNMREPGLTLSRLPPFVLSQLIAGSLLVAALPVLLGALTVLVLRGTPASSSLPHLFHLLAYPGFCIMILPGIGLVGEVMDRAARTVGDTGVGGRRLGLVAAAMSVLAVAGYMSWARPLLAAGLSGLDATIPLASLAIILPVLVVSVLWLWPLRHPTVRGALLGTVPGLYAAGFVAVLLGGGLDGLLFHAALSPTQLHDVLSIGTLFALFAGFFEHDGGMTGRAYPPTLARAQFFLLLVGAGLGALPGPIASALGAALTGAALLVFALIAAMMFGRRAPGVARVREIGA